MRVPLSVGGQTVRKDIMSIAKVKYECKTAKGKAYTIIAEMIDNGGFNYGNKHAVVVTDNGGFEKMWDVRYDARFNTVSKFLENIVELLKEDFDMAEYTRVECISEGEGEPMDSEMPRNTKAEQELQKEIERRCKR